MKLLHDPSTWKGALWVLAAFTLGSFLGLTQGACAAEVASEPTVHLRSAWPSGSHEAEANLAIACPTPAGWGQFRSWLAVNMEADWGAIYSYLAKHGCTRFPGVLHMMDTTWEYGEECREMDSGKVIRDLPGGISYYSRQVEVELAGGERVWVDAEYATPIRPVYTVRPSALGDMQ